MPPHNNDHEVQVVFLIAHILISEGLLFAATEVFLFTIYRRTEAVSFFHALPL